MPEAYQNHWRFQQSEEGNHDKIVVSWWKCGDADPPTLAKKTGEFVFTLTPANTWTTEKAAIETKITADDGIHTQ